MRWCELATAVRRMTAVGAFRTGLRTEHEVVLLRIAEVDGLAGWACAPSLHVTPQIGGTGGAEVGVTLHACRCAATRTRDAE